MLKRKSGDKKEIREKKAALNPSLYSPDAKATLILSQPSPNQATLTILMTHNETWKVD